MNKYDVVIQKRNEKWNQNPNIPKWVNIKNVDLDQFFTKNKTAKYCYSKLLSFLNSRNINLNDCLFIEPSAGSGSFFNLLPPDKRIGLDIYPMQDNIEEQEFLSWVPPKTNKKIIVIGNPPFGYRAWLALLFMQKASSFADYIAFILPMSFQSEGKGSPKNRVKGMKIVTTEILPSNSFELPNGKDYKINSLFQIWEKGHQDSIQTDILNDYLEIFTVDNRKERLCGQHKMKDADFFLQRTFFNNPPILVKNFTDVKYVCGYGFILKKEKTIIKKIIDHIDWRKYSNLAAHGCHHISINHIVKALLDNGIRY